MQFNCESEYERCQAIGPPSRERAVVIVCMVLKGQRLFRQCLPLSWIYKASKWLIA